MKLPVRWQIYEKVHVVKEQFFFPFVLPWIFLFILALGWKNNGNTAGHLTIVKITKNWPEFCLSQRLDNIYIYIFFFFMNQKFLSRHNVDFYKE